MGSDRVAPVSVEKLDTNWPDNHCDWIENIQSPQKVGNTRYRIGWRGFSRAEIGVVKIWGLNELNGNTELGTETLRLSDSGHCRMWP